MSVLNGGKFGHGFVSAGFVEAVKTALAGMSKPALAAASIVVGGTSSVLAGGKFANGAVTASFQLAFNHFSHEGKTARLVIAFGGAKMGAAEGDSDSLRQFSKSLGGNYRDWSLMGGHDESDALDAALEFHKAEPNGQIVIFGYSRGGQAAVNLANSLGKRGISVERLLHLILTHLADT